MSPRLKRKMIGLVLAGSLAALAWLTNRDSHGGGADGGRESKRPQAGGASSRDGEAGRSAGGGFERLEECTLVKWGGNDGDSFKVRHGGKENVFRTYFVDCPEKGLGSRVDIQESMRKRIDYQRKYFGDLSAEQVVSVGKEAQGFTIDLLGKSTFTVETSWERVMGGDRFFAFILVNESAANGQREKPEYLSRILVREGLARIYGMPSDHPSGLTEDRWKADLRALEAEARNAGRGAWRF